MLIYSPEISPRLEYTLDMAFRELLQMDFELTDSRERLMNHAGPRLNYSSTMIDGIPWVQAGTLLLESKIEIVKPGPDDTTKWDGLPAFFPSDPRSIVPFDIFSAVFYMLSRYEEYIPFEADRHGRFYSDLSIGKNQGFIEKPIVDLWLNKFGRLISDTFSGKINIKKPQFNFDSTIDIDNAWAFRNKGILRTIGSVLKRGQSMETRNFRYQVLRGKQEDPFYQYPRMEIIHRDFGIEPKFFFLLGPNGKFDRNIDPHNQEFQKLIRDISNKYETGIHPSYSSNSEPDTIRHEKAILEEIAGREIVSSRQHYLRLKIPTTYRSLIRAGIKNDYTMGYADCSGFRAGTSHPFRFFDLENNKATELLVFPFQVMDTGLRDYEKLDPQRAVEKIRVLIDNTREAGGTFRCLWHNESFSEWAGWEGWTAVYRQMLQMAAGQ